MASAFLDRFGEAFGPAFGSIEGHPIFNARVITALNLAAAAYHPSIDSACWQDVAGTIPAGNGDPIRKLDDITGNGHHRTAVGGSSPPVRRFADGIWYIDHHGVDVVLEASNVVDVAQSFHTFGALRVDVGSLIGSQRPGLNFYTAGSNYLQTVIDSDGSVDFVMRGDLVTPAQSNNAEATPPSTVDPAVWNTVRTSMQAGQYAIAANGAAPTTGVGWPEERTAGSAWRFSFANRGGNPADVAAPVQQEAASLIVNADLTEAQVQLCWDWVAAALVPEAPPIYALLVDDGQGALEQFLVDTDQPFLLEAA